MSNQAFALELDRAELLARKLAAAVSARRIYAADHSRVRTALTEFLGLLRTTLEEEGHERLRLTLTGGVLTHEGVPLEAAHANTQLANLLEERDCGGLVLRGGLAGGTVEVLIDWLSGRRAPALKPRGDGLELLDPGAGEELQDSDDKTRLVERLPEFRLPREVLESALDVVNHMMDDVRACRAVDFREISQLTRLACEAARSEGLGLVAATQLPRDNPNAHDHAINVFLMTTAMMQPFAREPKELEAYAQAALMHDVGTSYVSGEILGKVAAGVELTGDEAVQMRRHTEYGAKIIAQMPRLDPLAVEVAYCHHMRDDGQGYPTPIMTIKPGPVTNMVQIGDMFEQAAEIHAPNQALGAEQAINRVLEQPGMESKRNAIAHFLRRMTNTPPGCEVQLENGARAIVVECFADNPDHPRVRVIREADGRPVLEPYIVDLRDAGPESKPVVEVRLKPS